MKEKALLVNVSEDVKMLRLFLMPLLPPSLSLSLSLSLPLSLSFINDRAFLPLESKRTLFVLKVVGGVWVPLFVVQGDHVRVFSFT